MKRRTRTRTAVRGSVLCARLLVGVAACGGDDSGRSAATDAGGRAATTEAAGAAHTAAARGDRCKIGFITKFPVDFYDTMVDAAKDWNKDHPEVELMFAQGASGTDDEGEIAAIESMVTQGVKAIVITPTSPNVQDALQKAVDGGIKVILVDNDIPGWDGKTSLRRHRQPGRRRARRRVHCRASSKPGDTIAVLEGVAGAPVAATTCRRLQDRPRRRLHDRRLAADRL